MVKNTLSNKASSDLNLLNKVIGSAKRKSTREPESDYGETFRDYGLLGVAAKATYRAVTGQPIRKQKSKKGADFDNSDFFNRIRDIYNDELQLNVPTLIENALENPTGTFKRETYVLNQKLDRLNDTAIEIKNLLKNKDKAAGAGAGEEDDSTIWDDMFGGDDIDIDIDRRRRRRPRGRGRGRFGRGVRGLGRGIGRMFSRGGAAVAAGVAGGAAAGVVGKNAAQVAAEAMGKTTATEVAETATKNAARESLEAGVKTTAKKNLGSIIAKVVGPKLASTAAKAIPGVGLVTGLGFGVYRYLQGDTTGAAAEIASGAASTIPLAGTAASLVGSVGLAARDVYKEMYGVFPEEDDASVRDERMTEIKDEVTNYVKGFSGSATEVPEGANPIRNGKGEVIGYQPEGGGPNVALAGREQELQSLKTSAVNQNNGGNPAATELTKQRARQKSSGMVVIDGGEGGVNSLSTLNADLPAVGASPISGTVNGFPIPGGQPSAPISETAAEKSKDPVLVIPTALAAGTYYLTTDKPTRTMDVTAGISRAMSVGGVGGRASGSMSMASGATATGKAGALPGALPTSTPAGITPSVTVPSATPGGGGGGGAIAAAPQAMTTGQQLSQMTQQSAPSRGSGAAPSAMGTGGGGVVTGDTISARTGPMTSVTRGPSRGAGQTAATAPSGTATETKPSAPTGTYNFTPRERATLDFVSKREGASDPNTIYGDAKGKAGQGTFSKKLKEMGYTKPLTEMSITEVLAMQKDLTKVTKGTLKHSPGMGTSAVGSGQMIRSTLVANLKAMGIPEDQWDKIKFDKDMQDRLTLQNFKSSGIGDPNADPSTWNQTRLGQQYESLDTRKGYRPMSQQEMASIQNASTERPTAVANAESDTATPKPITTASSVNPPPSEVPSSEKPAPTATEAKGQMSDDKIRKLMESPEQVKPGEDNMAASEIKKGFESTALPPDAPKAAETTASPTVGNGGSAAATLLTKQRARQKSSGMVVIDGGEESANPLPTPNAGRAIPAQARAPDPMQQMMGMVQSFMGGQGGMPNTTQPTPLPKGIGDFAFRKGEMPWGMSKTMSRDSQGVTTMFDPAGGAAGIFAGGGQEAFQ